MGGLALHRGDFHPYDTCAVPAHVSAEPETPPETKVKMAFAKTIHNEGSLGKIFTEFASREA